MLSVILLYECYITMRTNFYLYFLYNFYSSIYAVIIAVKRMCEYARLIYYVDSFLTK